MNTPRDLALDRAPGATSAAGRPPTRREQRVRALRVDVDADLREVVVPITDPFSGMRVYLGTRVELATGGGAGVEVLDVDLAMWFDEDGAEHAAHNPLASVVAAMFGRPGPVYGPVVFTGCARPRPGQPVGELRDLSVAAALLLVGTAPTCDPPTTAAQRPAVGAGAAPQRALRRAAEFADLGIDVLPAPRTGHEHTLPADPWGDQAAPVTTSGAVPGDRPGDRPGDQPGDRAGDRAAVSYDALAHTVTVDGDLPCCAECGEPAPSRGHPEHQPEVLAARGTPQL